VFQTNISHNNNKFYVLQLLEDDNKSSWWVWTRWGRGTFCQHGTASLTYLLTYGPLVVGVTGQKKPIPFSNLDKAKNEFNKKYAATTTCGTRMRASEL